MKWEERAESTGRELRRVLNARHFVARRLDPEDEIYDRDPIGQDYWQERAKELAVEHLKLEQDWHELLREAEAA